MAGRLLAAAVLGALVVVAPMAALPAHAAVDRGTAAPPGATKGTQDGSAKAEKADKPKRNDAKADEPKADSPKPDKPKGDASPGEPPAPAPAKPEPAPSQPEPSKPEPSKPEPRPEPSPAQPPAPGSPAQPVPSRPTPQQPNPVQPEPEQPTPAQPTPAQPAPVRPAPVRPEPERPVPEQPVPGETTASPGPQAHRPQLADFGTEAPARPRVLGIDGTPVFWNVRVGPPRELADPGSVPPSRGDAGRTAESTEVSDSAAAALGPASSGSGGALTLGVLFAALALGGVILSLRRDLRRPNSLP